MRVDLSNEKFIKIPFGTIRYDCAPKFYSYQTLGCHFVEGRVLYKMHVPASLIHDLLTLVPPFCSERFLLQHGGHAFCRKTPSRTFTRPPIL